jgi:hypothetical protein
VDLFLLRLFLIIALYLLLKKGGGTIFCEHGWEITHSMFSCSCVLSGVTNAGYLGTMLVVDVAGVADGAFCAQIVALFLSVDGGVDALHGEHGYELRVKSLVVHAAHSFGGIVEDGLVTQGDREGGTMLHTGVCFNDPLSERCDTNIVEAVGFKATSEHGF